MLKASSSDEDCTSLAVIFKVPISATVYWHMCEDCLLLKNRLHISSNSVTPILKPLIISPALKMSNISPYKYFLKVLEVVWCLFSLLYFWHLASRCEGLRA